ncbi:MAG: hypothetical protein Q7S52_02830 [bacterium]|nr:hypothetical protein [bacterium]
MGTKKQVFYVPELSVEFLTTWTKDELVNARSEILEEIDRTGSGFPYCSNFRTLYVFNSKKLEPTREPILLPWVRYSRGDFIESGKFFKLCERLRLFNVDNRAFEEIKESQMLSVVRHGELVRDVLWARLHKFGLCALSTTLNFVTEYTSPVRCYDINVGNVVKRTSCPGKYFYVSTCLQSRQFELIPLVPIGTSGKRGPDQIIAYLLPGEAVPVDHLPQVDESEHHFLSLGLSIGKREPLITKCRQGYKANTPTAGAEEGGLPMSPPES